MTATVAWVKPRKSRVKLRRHKVATIKSHAIELKTRAQQVVKIVSQLEVCSGKTMQTGTAKKFEAVIKHVNSLMANLMYELEIKLESEAKKEIEKLKADLQHATWTLNDKVQKLK